MAGFNKVILMGNLTRDPELRETPSGTKVSDLRLAVSEKYRNRQSGELTEVTCFVDVVVWERQAELCEQYLAKGRPVLVEGRLQLDEWKNDQGETRSKLKVRGDRITFLGSAPGREEDRKGDFGAPARDNMPAAPDQGEKTPEPSAGEDAAEDSDDLPF